MFNSVAEKIIPESPQFEKSPLEVSDTYVTNGNVGIEGSERDFSASRVRNINFFTSRIILLFGDKKMTWNIEENFSGINLPVGICWKVCRRMSLYTHVLDEFRQISRTFIKMADQTFGVKLYELAVYERGVTNRSFVLIGHVCIGKVCNKCDFWS